jgi:hypothetical protein
MLANLNADLTIERPPTGLQLERLRALQISTLLDQMEVTSKLYRLLRSGKILVHSVDALDCVPLDEV